MTQHKPTVQTHYCLHPTPQQVEFIPEPDAALAPEIQQLFSINREEQPGTTVSDWMCPAQEDLETTNHPSISIWSQEASNSVSRGTQYS